MRKLFTLIAIAALALGANAQRAVDFEVTSIAKPTQITTRTGWDVEFTVTNKGPDAVKPVDSLFWRMIINNQIIVPGNFYYQSPKAMAANDTMIIKAFIPITSVNVNSDFNGPFCVNVILQNRSTTDSVKIENNSFTNNTKCNTISYKTWGVGMNDADGMNVYGPSAYPNPASDNLNISYRMSQSGLAMVRIYDITGKLVTSEKFETISGEQVFKINTSSLMPGIYFYELDANGSTMKNKFVISR